MSSLEHQLIRCQSLTLAEGRRLGDLLHEHKTLKAMAQYYAERVQLCAETVKRDEQAAQRAANDLAGARTALASAEHFFRQHQGKLDAFERANAEALHA